MKHRFSNSTAFSRLCSVRYTGQKPDILQTFTIDTLSVNTIPNHTELFGAGLDTLTDHTGMFHILVWLGMLTETPPTSGYTLKSTIFFLFYRRAYEIARTRSAQNHEFNRINFAPLRSNENNLMRHALIYQTVSFEEKMKTKGGFGKKKTLKQRGRDDTVVFKRGSVRVCM